VRPLNNLVDLYGVQGRYADALPLLQRLIASGRAEPSAAFPSCCPVLGTNNLISAGKALDDSLNVVPAVPPKHRQHPPSTNLPFVWPPAAIALPRSFA